LTAAGDKIGYGRLIWAAGGTPRMLPVPSGKLPGVQVVRTRADVDAMKVLAEAATRVVVIGGGYIGLEAASVLTKFSKKVILLEALDRVLARVAGEQLSRFIEGEHRHHGVDLRLNARIEAIEGVDRATGVRLSGGEVIPAELVIAGIGIIPAVQPLIDAGVKGGNGVLVDQFCRTSLPDIFAIGDCAAHPSTFSEGAVIRIESVQNATDQAALVAKAICGDPRPYCVLPWFWSHQYDLRIQTVGLSSGHDSTVLRGHPNSRAFSVIYLRRGKAMALDCVNAPRDYIQGRALVAAGISACPATLSNPALALKDLIPTSPSNPPIGRNHD
jgi:3-phenylpropionate/trans-cinnamate dioxygenase ferredoxin reductase component